MAGAGGKALIGRDLVLHGEIRNGGEVEVLGTVVGAVSAERVIIHPGGRVSGQLNAGSADVHGHLKGRIRVRNLINIGADGVVEGDVRYGQLALAPGGDLAARVRNVPPELGGDFEVIVRRGRAVRLTASDLTASDPDDAADTLTYHVSSPEHGFVAMAASPAEAISAFTQADIHAGRVLFVHDGASGQAAAGFDVVVADGAGGTSGAPRRVAVVVV